MTVGRCLASGAAAIVLAASLAGCHRSQSGPVAPVQTPSATTTLIIPPTRIPPHPPLSLQPT